MQLSEVQLATCDIAGTKKFYTEILGFELLAHSPDLVTFRAGNSKLSFRHTEGRKPVYHFAFTIPANKLNQAFNWACRRLEILWASADNPIAPFPSWDARAFYFRDNNGNILEYIARYAIDNASDEDFGGHSVFSLSEIGIVVDDVPRFCKETSERYSIDLFSKQPAGDQFTVLGDDYGLLIVVGRGRTWFPTGTEARPAPVRILFTDAQGRTQEIDIPGGP